MGSVPAIQYAVNEAAEAGITEVAVVVRQGKELIASYLETLDHEIVFTFVHQDEPTGLGDALLLCRDFVGDESFGLLLPDNVILAAEYRFSTLVEAAQETGTDIVGVLQLDSLDSGMYGNSGRIEHREMRPGLFRVERLHDKHPGVMEIGAGEEVFRACGRYVCRPHLLDWLERLKADVVGETDEVPAYQRIAAAGGLHGVPVPRPLFDVGQPRGFMAANAFLRDQPDWEGSTEAPFPTRQ